MAVRPALLAVLLALACNSRSVGDLFDPSLDTAAPSESSERGSDTLIVGRAADAIGLDPARYTDNESVEVCEQIYEHLVRYKPESLEVEPALALSWEVTPDGTQWTFKLRPGVRFHDGTPLDADAVVFSFERQLRKEHPFHLPDFMYWETSFATIVKDVRKVDDLTVRITIYRPYAPFLSSLAMFPVSIVSPTAVRTWGEDFTRHPVGTGPFRFVAWAPGDRIVLERWDGYWGKKPRLKRLVFRHIPDARQRLVALEGGAVDVAAGILPEELQFVELHPDLVLHKIPGQNVAYLAMNTMRAPWGQVAVRHAVNHAVNKEPIVKLVYQGLAVPARGALPPTLWSYREDVATYPYDPARARALLDEAERAGTFDCRKKYRFYAPRTARSYLPDPEQVARVIQRNLQEVGIQTELILNDFGTHLLAVERGEHDLCLLGWAGDMGDPDNFLYLLLDRDNAVPGLARNVAFYSSAQVHGLLSWAQSTHDRAEREKYYREAQAIIANDAPWVPLAHSQIAVAAHENVRGLSIHPSALIYYAGVWLLR